MVKSFQPNMVHASRAERVPAFTPVHENRLHDFKISNTAWIKQVIYFFLQNNAQKCA